MRTCSALRLGAVVAALCVAVPAYAFDPTPETDTPAKAFRYGYEAYRDGDITTALDAIKYAADQGYTRALWLLARMYADGDGVVRDDAQAFAMFEEIVRDHAGDRRITVDTPFVADAYVALGDYYRDGVNAPADPNAAFQLYWHAATYLNDPEAQYNLAVMYLNGEVGPPNPAQAVRWAHLSAEAGNISGQALLGYLLFQGEGVARQAVFGLAYLQVALVRTGGADPDIRRMHEGALALATETERRTAMELANSWLAANPVAVTTAGRREAEGDAGAGAAPAAAAAPIGPPASARDSDVVPALVPASGVASDPIPDPASGPVADNRPAD